MTLRKKKFAKKKEEILHSAINIIAERGYHGTTMEDIASNLFITKGSLYYYFKDKQELVFQSQIMLLLRSIDNMIAVQLEDILIAEKLRKAMRVHVTYLLRERSGFEMMIQPDHLFSKQQLEEIVSLREQYGTYFDQMINDGIEEKVFHVTDSKIVRNIILGAMNWVTQWYSPKGKKDVTEIADTIADHLMRVVIKN
ncbi:TetR/AcrR family transcriptional regulator [Aquibacillus sp. 3ASR75-11]|uniref:TetR/AcrR family transcriptional regulator n=1 Tax=Terrihalobacillus insolitus TaxID=2950438 RepID=A0A9X3WSH2_9BACI|nr:TetR/AcrR family transcriptional regulator [Terrihalobacillus insolitus]MDC3411880.1 TetR/AcrR family transcriptional regulator [Terrihalobacillus insolitus]MDC3423441.1 TetR/AcrR family transcriptional regulator [Terrihalobacillus insolitus]